MGYTERFIEGRSIMFKYFEECHVLKRKIFRFKFYILFEFVGILGTDHFVYIFASCT
jgi:hypothetical protein